MSETLFYYDRRKSFIDGLILTVVSLLFQPFYLLFHEGLIGLLISILPFQFLIKGLIYLIRSLWPLPAVQLTPQGLEFNTSYMFHKKIKWNEVRSVEYIEKEGNRSSGNNNSGGIKFRFRISDYEKHFIVLRTNDERTYSISTDGINLEGKDLEEMIRDYKRMYFFDS